MCIFGDEQKYNCNAMHSEGKREAYKRLENRARVIGQGNQVGFLFYVGLFVVYRGVSDTHI